MFHFPEFLNLPFVFIPPPPSSPALPPEKKSPNCFNCGTRNLSVGKERWINNVFQY